MMIADSGLLFRATLYILPLLHTKFGERTYVLLCRSTGMERSAGKQASTQDIPVLSSFHL